MSYIDYRDKKEGWTKINYGGKPTTNQDKKYAIFVGRFQPYHQGHISLIQQKLDEGVPPLILIRDIQPDEKNPFTTEETALMITKYHKAKGDDVKVMAVLGVFVLVVVVVLQKPTVVLMVVQLLLTMVVVLVKY